MRKKAFKIIILIIGIFLMTFPISYSLLKDLSGISQIYKYQSEVLNMTNDQITEKYQKLQDYNNRVKYIFKADVSINKLDKLAKKDVIGYINIPKINVYLPIFTGSSKEELEIGVGHLENTSMPTGQKGTHCVLAGHTGIRRTKIFDDIHNLNIGDKFYITILNKKLEYRVDNIQVVNPDDTSAIQLDNNKDLVTLVTCTPRGQNTQRLLVRGIGEEHKNNIDTEKNFMINENKNTLKLIRKTEIITVAIIMSGIIAIIVLSVIIIKGSIHK